MATTARQIVTSGYAKSTKNKAGEIATEATEILRLMNRLLRKYFAFMARSNWTLVGKAATVAYDGTAGILGWPRPSDAEAVVAIFDGSQEIGVVPLEDRLADHANPCVYRYGGVYRSAANANDPTNQSLLFVYARRPTVLATIDDNLDTLWPETFNEVLELEVASYLARKNGRGDEVALFANEISDWMALFTQYCEHETLNERRRHNLTNRFVTTTQRPVGPG